MARLTDYATYYGAVFPSEASVSDGVQYGPTGAEYTGTATVMPDPTAIAGVLLASYDNEWVYIDGIEDAAYEFATTRDFRGATLTAPSSGVKVRRGKTSQKLLAIVANTVGLESTDCSWTIWASTLRDNGNVDGTRIAAMADDFLTPDGGDRWRILAVERTNDGAQYVCYCRKSVL